MEITFEATGLMRVVVILLSIAFVFVKLTIFQFLPWYLLPIILFLPLIVMIFLFSIKLTVAYIVAFLGG